MMGPLEGHHALITGGGTGIGATIATALSRDGAAITLAGRRQGPLSDVAGRLSRATAVAADVTRPEDCARMIRHANEAHGPIDIIIANAGIAETAPVARTDLALWQRMLDVNLTGAFLTVKAGLADVVREEANENRVRRVVFVASTAGLKGYAYVGAYCAAKHGVIGLARALAQELARTPVTVNAVCPGFTETPLLESSLDKIVGHTGRSRDDALKELTRHNPQGRLVKPEEVASTVSWLCSQHAASITGQAIAISGGEI